MRLTDILKEIKIQSPNSLIVLTDEGKQSLKDLNNLRHLLGKYCNESSFLEVFNEGYQTDKLTNVDFLSIFIDEKAIFEDKPTPLEYYYKRMSEFWDGDIHNLNSYLISFIKHNLIRPIKIKE